MINKVISSVKIWLFSSHPHEDRTFVKRPLWRTFMAGLSLSNLQCPGCDQLIARPVVIKPCLHSGRCFECTMKWFLHSSLCPLCRNEAISFNDFPVLKQSLPPSPSSPSPEVLAS